MTEIQPNNTENDRGAEGFVVLPAPNFTTGTLQGSMQQILSENLGRFVVCEFFMNDTARETKAGILHSVGASYLVLYDDAEQSYLVCDVKPLRFIAFTSVERQIAEEAPQAEPETQGETTPPPQTLNNTQNNPQSNQLTTLPPPSGVQQVGTSSQVKAAFNYTKRRARR